MGVLGFAVNVVSALHEPRFVDQRIEAFLTAFRDQLAKMSADEYAHHVEAFIADRTVPDYGLSDEASRLWYVTIIGLSERFSQKSSFLKIPHTGMKLPTPLWCLIVRRARPKSFGS